MLLGTNQKKRTSFADESKLEYPCSASAKQSNINIAVKTPPTAIVKRLAHFFMRKRPKGMMLVSATPTDTTASSCHNIADPQTASRYPADINGDNAMITSHVRLAAQGMEPTATMLTCKNRPSAATAVAAIISSTDLNRLCAIKLVALSIMPAHLFGGLPPKHSFVRTPSAWMSAEKPISPLTNCSGAA